MSKQLAVASAFSVFAMSALALLAPVSGGMSGSTEGSGSETAAPMLATDFLAPLASFD